MNILVAYFSASGITKEVAETITKVASEFADESGKVDIFEIAPKVPYSKADLDWTNEQSRTTIFEIFDALQQISREPGKILALTEFQHFKNAQTLNA